MKKIPLFALLLLLNQLGAQSILPDSCKIEIGTNLSGMFDWTTEMPFVNLMRHCRSWGTQNATWVGGGQNVWDTQVIQAIPRDAEGYPTQVPFFQPGLETGQRVYTVWANTEAWPAGTYTLLYDGEGELDLWGDADIVSRQPGIILATVTPGVDNIIQLRIDSSNPQNHVRNIRFLMPGTANTYEASPYYQPWLDKLAPFKALRFMDWGQTNSWGYNDAWESYNEDSDSIRQPWAARSRMTDYTWTQNKGVPYEVMVDLCNRLQKDMWICVPHNASNEYIREMATLVRDQLDPSLTVYVEYSNELWNWIFGQAQWLNKFGCVQQNKPWPEGIVPYIQNCLDIWTEVFEGQSDRLVRVVGVQAAWQDVSNRTVYNMRPGSVDAFSPAAYFGLSDASDAELDALGSAASAADVSARVYADRENDAIPWLRTQQTEIGDVLGLPMIYYEGGQHITPHPFGAEPTYAQALLDVQRDPVMYDLYDSWFDTLRAIHQGDRPALFMSFSFVSSRSARYGSWGILESVTQDIGAVPAPKYEAILDNIFTGCAETTSSGAPLETAAFSLYPNPVEDMLFINGEDIAKIQVFSASGRLVLEKSGASDRTLKSISVGHLPEGMYFVVTRNRNGVAGNGRFIRMN